MSNLRAPSGMPNKDNPDETWAFLEKGVEQIMTNLNDGMSMATYMSLYTSVHNFCTAQKNINHHHGFAPGPQNRGGAHLLGEGLYQRLEQYLNNHLTGVKKEASKHSGEELLQFYIKEWKRYTTAGEYNNHLFRYLNRHWVKREMDEGKKDIYDIYTLHLVRWKEDMFGSTQNAVMDAVLRL